VAEPELLDYVRENGFSTSAGYRDGVPKCRDPDLSRFYHIVVVHDTRPLLLGYYSGLSYFYLAINIQNFFI